MGQVTRRIAKLSIVAAVGVAATVGGSGQATTDVAKDRSVMRRTPPIDPMRRLPSVETPLAVQDPEIATAANATDDSHSVLSSSLRRLPPVDESFAEPEPIVAADFRRLPSVDVTLPFEPAGSAATGRVVRRV
jgi:hypothetical protein